MRCAAPFFAFALLAFSARPAPAEPASDADVLDLLEGALAAGEGVPARALLERYLSDHDASARTSELDILTSYYTGDYEAAAEGVLSMRKDPRAPADLGSFADVIVNTYETTKNYETFRYENFEVRYEPGPDEILVPYAVDTLKATTDALASELGVTMVSPVRLEIYPDAESLARVSTLSVEAIRTTGTIALCKWGRLMVASPRALMHGYPWLDTIAHEYVHLLLTKATLDRAPVWLQEGVAKFLETRWREDEATLPNEPASRRILHEAAMTDELLDFDQLHPSIALLPTQKAASLAFAQVSSFIASFYAQYGAEGLQQVLKRVSEGEDAKRALARVAGVKWKTLEGRWKDDLAKAPEAPARATAASVPERRSERTGRGRGRRARPSSQVLEAWGPALGAQAPCGSVGRVRQGPSGRAWRPRRRIPLRAFSHRWGVDHRTPSPHSRRRSSFTRRMRRRSQAWRLPGTECPSTTRRRKPPTGRSRTTHSIHSRTASSRSSRFHRPSTKPRCAVTLAACVSDVASQASWR